MSKVHIDKFIGQQHESNVTIPGFLVGIADKMLPRFIIDSLEEQGIDIPAIAEARRTGCTYSRSIDIVEKGVAKKVFVSLEH